MEDLDAGVFKMILDMSDMTLNRPQYYTDLSLNNKNGIFLRKYLDSINADEKSALKVLEEELKNVNNQRQGSTIASAKREFASKARMGWKPDNPQTWMTGSLAEKYRFLTPQNKAKFNDLFGNENQNETYNRIFDNIVKSTTYKIGNNVIKINPSKQKATEQLQAVVRRKLQKK